MIEEHKLGKYTFFYGMKALRAAENQLGPLPKVMRDPDKANSATTVSILAWAGLAKHHDLSLDQVDDVIDELGLKAVGSAIETALHKAYPDTSADTPGKPKAS